MVKNLAFPPITFAIFYYESVSAQKQIGNQMSVFVKVVTSRKVNSCGNKAPQRLN